MRRHQHGTVRRAGLDLHARDDVRRDRHGRSRLAGLDFRFQADRDVFAANTRRSDVDIVVSAVTRMRFRVRPAEVTAARNTFRKAGVVSRTCRIPGNAARDIT